MTVETADARRCAYARALCANGRAHGPTANQARIAQMPGRHRTLTRSHFRGNPCRANQESSPHASRERRGRSREAGRQFNTMVDSAIVRILAEPTPLGRTIRPGVRSGKEVNGATGASHAFDCREPAGVRCVSGLPPRLSTRRTSSRRQPRSCESRLTVDVWHHAAGPR